MKKHLIVFFLVFYVLLASFLLTSLPKTEEVSTNNIFYGKITESCLLKKTPTKLSNTSNIYFLLEESYYVKVLSEENDFYYVQYLDLNGYVEKNSIKLVNEQVENPYLENITFDIIKDTFLYEEAKNSDLLIKAEVKLRNNIIYYGKVYSEEIDENSGNVWYYCKLTENGKTLTGYIHSKFTNNLTPIILNDTITSEFINQENTNELLNLNFATQNIIVIIISVPILFIIFLFLKGFKKV